MPVRYPPGPANFNAWCGFTWRHAVGQLADPLHFVSDLAERYGDLVFYRLFIHRAYQVNHPDLVREVLITKAASFVKQRRQRELIQRIAGCGILTSDGPEWIRRRQIMLPAFQSQIGKRLATTAVEEAQRVCDTWTHSPTVSLYSSMTDLMVRAVGRSFFGIQTPDEASELADALHTLGGCLLDLDYFLVRLPGWFPSLKARQRRAAEETLRRYFDRVISARGGSADGDDLLSLLLNAKDEDGSRLSDEEVVNEARTMFFAGHHTAAACLTWTLYLLATHPPVRERLLQEIDDVLHGAPPTPDDIARLTYTTQVIQESMRLYPPAWALFAREAIEDVEISGYTLPRGSWVFIYPWVLHRDGRFFADPLRFDPERFSPQQLARQTPGSYIPFGLGGHSCIGGRIAMMAVQVALPTLLQRFVLDLPANAPPPVLQTAISLRPRYELQFLARERTDRGIRRAPESLSSTSAP